MQMKTQLTALAAGVLTLVHAVPGNAADAALAGASVVITGQRAMLAKSIAAQDKADNIVSALST